MVRSFACLMVLGLCFASSGFVTRGADEEKKETPVIKPEKAVEYYDKEVVVEFKVEGGYFRDMKPPCLLNSKKNHQDKDNLTIAILGRELKEFKAAGIEDPAMHYAGKTIKVRGIVEMFKDKPQIKVTNVKQIEIVGEDKKDAEKKSKDEKDDKPIIDLKKQD
ncbi:MAG: hypothetical protein QM811_20720 [Pirellulales bacterium]